jgi:hypothetical protein
VVGFLRNAAFTTLQQETMMAVDIQNRSAQRVRLNLNSGLTRYLGPGEVMRGVEEVDIRGNTRIERLRNDRIIDFANTQARGLRSKEMRAEEAIDFIRRAPRSDLERFLSDDETRVSVRRAMEERETE